MTTASISECPAAPHDHEAKARKIRAAGDAIRHWSKVRAKCAALTITAEARERQAIEDMDAMLSTYAARREVAR